MSDFPEGAGTYLPTFLSTYLPTYQLTYLRPNRLRLELCFDTRVKLSLIISVNTFGASIENKLVSMIYETHIKTQLRCGVGLGVGGDWGGGAETSGWWCGSD